MRHLRAVFAVAVLLVTVVRPASAQPTPGTLEAWASVPRAGAIPLRPPPAKADLEQWEGASQADLIVRNVTSASVRPFLPAAGTGTGAAVIVAPGGGFHFLSMGNEGVPVAQWLAKHGIAAFLLKYRTVATPRDQAAFSATVHSAIAGLGTSGVAHPLAGEAEARDDTIAALRLVHERASTWQVDPKRIGVLGFSAGAIAALGATLASVRDARPAFAGIIYGRMLAVAVPANAPPLFVAFAADDPFLGSQGFALVQSWRAAGKLSELHSYERGGHGFGMKRQGFTSDYWDDQFLGWLRAGGFLKSSPGLRVRSSDVRSNDVE